MDLISGDKPLWARCLFCLQHPSNTRHEALLLVWISLEMTCLNHHFPLPISPHTLCSFRSSFPPPIILPSVPPIPLSWRDFSPAALSTVHPHCFHKIVLFKLQRLGAYLMLVLVTADITVFTRNTEKGYFLSP